MGVRLLRHSSYIHVTILFRAMYALAQDQAAMPCRQLSRQPYRPKDEPAMKVSYHEAEESNIPQRRPWGNCAHSRSRSTEPAVLSSHWKNPVVVTPRWKNRPFHRFQSSLLSADTIIATCGLENFEDSTYSHGHRHFKPANVQPGLVTPFHINYDHGAHSRFMHSFKVNFPELVAGRNIILIDCTVIKNPQHDKRLRNHLGTHPQTWTQVLAHKKFVSSHRELTKLSTTEKNLIICACKSGCHRSLASCYSIEHVIKVRPQNKGVQTINLQEQHHLDQKCDMCPDCSPTQPANDVNREAAYRLLDPMIPWVQVPRSTSYEPSYWPDRRINIALNTNELPPITRKRRHSNDDWSSASSGGAHPTIPRAKVPRSTSYETSCPWRQCSSDAHDKTPTPKARPRQASDCVHHTTKRGRSLDRPSMSSGGVHPTKEPERSRKSSMDSKAKTVLLFNDRPKAATTEKVAAQVQADIVFNVGSQNSHGCEWEVVNRNRWLSGEFNGMWQEKSARQKHVLAKSNVTTIVTLTRPVHLPGDIHEIQVILARSKHGHIATRKAAVFGLFDLLIQTKKPALVLANVGTSTGSMSKFVHEYNESNSRADQHIRIIHNDKQAICLALATFAQARKLAAVEITAATETAMFAVQLHLGKVSCTDANEKTPLEPAPKKSKTSLTARERADAEWNISLADARQEQDDDVFPGRRINNDPHREAAYTDRNNDGVHLVDNQKKTLKDKYKAMLTNVHMRPEDKHRETWGTQLRKLCSTQGQQCTRPLMRMKVGFDILKRARHQVGESSDKETITDEQFQKALDWLKYDLFEVSLMRNQDLKHKITTIQEFEGAAKKQIQVKRRGAFKTFKWQLLGSTALLHMVLRHGIFDAGEQRRFLLAYEQILEDHLRQTTPTIDVGSPIYKDMQRKAHKAREDEKRANKMALQVAQELDVKFRKMSTAITPLRNSIESNFEELVALSPDKEWMLTALESGQLESTRQKADELLGHGRHIVPKRGRAMHGAAFERAFGHGIAPWNR